MATASKLRGNKGDGASFCVLVNLFAIDRFDDLFIYLLHWRGLLNNLLAITVRLSATITLGLEEGRW